MDKMREEFTALAEVEFRNDEEFTHRDFDIAFRGYQAAQPRWIPVSERLPEPGETVLVYSPPQPGDYPDSVRISFDGIDPESDGDYWIDHGEHYEHWCSIAKDNSGDWVGPSEKAPYTHWMPLPTPPAQGEK